MRYLVQNTTWLCSELVTLLYKNGAELCETTANLEQISRSSAVLLSDVTITPATAIAFVAQGYLLRGTVTSVENDDALGTFLSIELDTETQWSPECFRPEHALCVDAQQAMIASAA